MAVLVPVPRLAAFQRGTSLSKRRFGCARSSAAARRGRGTELRPWDKGGGDGGGAARRDGTRGSLRPWGGGGAAVGLSSGGLCHPTALRAPRDPGQHFPFSLPPRFASPPRPLSQPCPDQRSAIPLVNDPQRSGHASRRTWGGMGTAVPPQCHRGAAPSPDAVGEHRPEEPNLHRWGTGMGPLRSRSPAGPQRYRHGTPSAEPTPDAAPPRLSSTPSPSKEPPPGTRSPFLRAIRCSPQGWALPIVLMGEKGGFIVLWDGGEGGLIVLHGGERGAYCSQGGLGEVSPAGRGGSWIAVWGSLLFSRRRRGVHCPGWGSGAALPRRRRRSGGGPLWGEEGAHGSQGAMGGGEGDAAPRGGGTGGGAPIVLCGAQGGGRALSGGSRHTPSQRGSGEGGSHRPGEGSAAPRGLIPERRGGGGGHKDRNE